MIFTDHKPLVAASCRVSPPWSARLQQQLAYIAEFAATLRHTPGVDNVVADAMSRHLSASQPAEPARAAPDSSPTPIPAQPAPTPSPSSPSGDWSATSGACSAPTGVRSAPSGSCPAPPGSCSAPSGSCSAITAVEAATEPLDYAVLAAQQRLCPEVSAMRVSDKLDIVYRRVGAHFIYGDISTPVF